MQRVLVTAIGSFAADIVIKTLKRCDCKVFGCDVYDKELIADAYNVDVFYKAPYATDVNRYISFLLEICEKNNISYIFPLTDVEIDALNKHRDVFDCKGIMLCMSSEKTIDLCRNKYKMNQFILSNGSIVETIPTTLASETTDAPYNFPLICKPIDGRSSQGNRIISSKKEWELLIKTCDLEKYIVQPQLLGDVVTVDIVRSENGENIAAIPRKEILRTLNGAGTSVLVFSDELLETQAKKLADMLDVIGCVNFEFILCGDKYYFLECNPRFSGGVEFSCIAGYDCILNHLRCFQNKRIDTFVLKNSMYIARKYEEYITKLVDLNSRCFKEV